MILATQQRLLNAGFGFNETPDGCVAVTAFRKPVEHFGTSLTRDDTWLLVAAWLDKEIGEEEPE